MLSHTHTHTHTSIRQTKLNGLKYMAFELYIIRIEFEKLKEEKEEEERQRYVLHQKKYV